MEILYSGEEITRRITELGRKISEYYSGKELTVIALMNGGVFFAVDLVRQMNIPMWFDSLRASSYVHDRRTAKVNVCSDLKLPVVGRHLLLVDDVFDSGNTMEVCRRYLLDAGALSVKSAVLINKTVAERRSMPDWAAFSAPDYYLVGYGMDSEELYRNVPFVGKF